MPEPCPATNKPCGNFCYQREDYNDNTSPIALEFCSHPNNTSDCEGNCRSSLCPLLKDRTDKLIPIITWDDCFCEEWGYSSFTENLEMGEMEHDNEIELHVTPEQLKQLGKPLLPNIELLTKLREQTNA